MFLDKVETYNTGALEKIAGLGKNGFMRIPERVRNNLNNRARFVAMDSVGCEVRFVTDAPNVDIYLSCSKPEFNDTGEVRVYKGNFLCQCHDVEPGKVNFLRLNPPQAFNDASQKILDEDGFSQNVWRLVFNRCTTFFLHEIITHGYDLRPPKTEEKPKRNWLAYGSSITNSNLDGYPHFAAKKLRVQVQNKGLRGACQIEKEMVDFMVDDCEWDFASCELGVNMRGCFTLEEFEQRATYLVDRFTSTGKPVFIISIFPNCRTLEFTVKPGTDTDRESAYNTILSRLVENKHATNLHFIPGSSVLDDFSCLSGDLLHPCSYGHAVMGGNLAVILKRILNQE